MKKIVVVGSLNMDSVIEVADMPKKGETISGYKVSMIPGGKGANQAYAAGKLGGNVRMIGAVGNDSFGKSLKSNLESVGVDVSGIAVLEGETTGQAYITVDDSGENSIIIIAGTNGLVDVELVWEHRKLIEDSDIVILQFEIPLEVVEYVKDMAVKMGKTVIVDPAPARNDLPDGFWKGIHYIKPNETELETLVGRKLTTMEDIESGAREMLARGVQAVIVTLGGDGCFYVTKEKAEYFAANRVQVVDTTAAGDSFTAAFALALSDEKSCEEAIRFGQKVSSYVVTRKGAQTSIPTLEELDK